LASGFVVDVLDRITAETEVSTAALWVQRLFSLNTSFLLDLPGEVVYMVVTVPTENSTRRSSMPAYAYPIKINKRRQRVNFTEIHAFASNEFTLADLQFAGDDPFQILDSFPAGYEVHVSAPGSKPKPNATTELQRKRLIWRHPQAEGN
jgi:hypothetical protein